MPRMSRAPLFDDPFNYMIEVLDDAGKAVEAIAGAENGIAAGRALDALLEQYGPQTRLCLRQRGRVLRTLCGRKEA